MKEVVVVTSKVASVTLNSRDATTSRHRLSRLHSSEMPFYCNEAYTQKDGKHIS